MHWTGIHNENEFYSEHYLAEIFAGDVRGVLEDWTRREQAARERARTQGLTEPDWRAPHNRLATQARDALQTLEEIGRSRDPRLRLELGRVLLRRWLQVFELPWHPERRPVAGSEEVELPLLGELKHPDGGPLLWVLEAQPLADGHDLDADPLSLPIHPLQLQSLSATPIPKALAEPEPPDWNRLLVSAVFAQVQPPRWVLLAAPGQWLLIDRTKFAQHRLLRFDWLELLRRREPDTLKAVSVLLHKASLLDAQGQSLLERLDENAHKHAYGVSEDLKYALRECIELLGNEAARQLIAQARARKEGIYQICAAVRNLTSRSDLGDGEAAHRVLVLHPHPFGCPVRNWPRRGEVVRPGGVWGWLITVKRPTLGRFRLQAPNHTPLGSLCEARNSRHTRGWRE